MCHLLCCLLHRIACMGCRHAASCPSTPTISRSWAELSGLRLGFSAIRNAGTHDRPTDGPGQTVDVALLVGLRQTRGTTERKRSRSLSISWQRDLGILVCVSAGFSRSLLLRTRCDALSLVAEHCQVACTGCEDAFLLSPAQLLAEQVSVPKTSRWRTAASVFPSSEPASSLQAAGGVRFGTLLEDWPAQGFGREGLEYTPLPCLAMGRSYGRRVCCFGRNQRALQVAATVACRWMEKAWRKVGKARASSNDDVPLQSLCLCP